MQAGVIAHHLAGAGGDLEIGGDAAIDQVTDFEGGLVHLVADLEGVATVHEHGGLVLQDHRGAGRAGEAGGPGQPVVGGGQVLVLVLVLVGDEEAVQALLGHGPADQRHVLGREGAIGGFCEGLAHGRHVSRSTGPGQGVGLRNTAVRRYNLPMVTVAATSRANSNGPIGVVRLRAP